MSKMSKEVKTSMRKAVLTALGGFKDLMNNLEVQMKILFRNNKLNSGRFTYVLKVTTLVISSLLCSRFLGCHATLRTGAMRDSPINGCEGD